MYKSAKEGKKTNKPVADGIKSKREKEYEEEAVQNTKH